MTEHTCPQATLWRPTPPGTYRRPAAQVAFERRRDAARALARAQMKARRRRHDADRLICDRKRFVTVRDADGSVSVRCPKCGWSTAEVAGG